MSNVLVHDDDCDEVLVDGYCNRCRFAPDAQSVARVDVRGLLREMPTLRARLAECERERDEARNGSWAKAVDLARACEKERDTAYDRGRAEGRRDVEPIAGMIAKERADAIEERDSLRARLATPIACPRCDRDDLTVGDLPGHLPCLSRTETEERLGEVEAERDALRTDLAHVTAQAGPDSCAGMAQRHAEEVAALRAQVARQAKVVNLARTHAFSSGWMMKGELQDAIRALDAAGEVERD